MAVLEKIRVKFGILITILVALALLSFIIDPQTLQSAFQMMSSDNKVGEMNGKNINYREFYEDYDEYLKLYGMMGQNTNSEEAQAAIRNVAWQDNYTRLVFAPKAKKAGIYVGDQEMYDLTQGANISPVLLQQPMFADESGNFNRGALLNFVQTIDEDATGQATAYWNFLEKSIYDAQLYGKYAALIHATSLENNVEKAALVAENNTTYDVDYVTIPLGFEPDSTVTVSASEVKEYYNARKNNLRQPANRDIEYVMFEVEPSQADIEAKRAEFEEVYNGFKTADNLKNYVALHSDTKWDNTWYSKAALEGEPEFQAVAFGGRAQVSEIREDGTSFSAARVAERGMVSDSAHVYYAAFALTDEASADELVKKAKASHTMPEGFNEMGWLTQQITAANGLTDFDVVFAQNAGRVVKVRSIAAQGIFVLYVSERSRAQEKVRLARLVGNILPSEETYRDFLMKATELSDKSNGKYEKFAEVCREESLPVIPVQNVTEGTRRIGVVDNARELVRWVFEKKTKKNSVSDVVSVDNKYYFVAAVTEVRKEGQVELKDVADQFVFAIRAEKSLDKLRDKVAEEIKNCASLQDVANLYELTVSHSHGLSFGSQYQNSGLLGAVVNAPIGELRGPVKAEYGVTVFQVQSKDTGVYFTEDDVDTRVSQRADYALQVLDQAISEEANIKDYRARFF